MEVFVFGEYEVKAPEGSRLAEICGELKQEFPQLRMSHKRKMWRHRIAHVLVIIFTLGLNRKYLRKFTTTSRNRIDWSDAHNERIEKVKELDRVWECLRHEREHLRQFRDKGTLIMVLIWLIPPILFCYGRAISIEKPGYLESLRAKFESCRAWAEHSEYRRWWVRQFTGPNYGFMWVMKSHVGGWFDEELKRLQKEDVSGSTGA